MPAILQFQGLPCVELSLPAGDRVRVALQGAHVLSWTTADGRERMYLSPKTYLDGHSPIRGGVPICFPQFNQRVLGELPLPKHGLARTALWALQDIQQDEGAAQVIFQWGSRASTCAVWPHAFTATMTVRLEPASLCMRFQVTNTDTSAWPFALALHTYLGVDDIAHTRLTGLKGLTYWDGVQHLQQPDLRLTQAEEALTFTGETDRVHAGVQAPLTLQHPGGQLCITQSASLPDAVVWNPGAERCAALDDMPPDGYRNMLCVEAACINTPVRLQPGESWCGWQALRVVT